MTFLLHSVGIGRGLVDRASRTAAEQFLVAWAPARGSVAGDKGSVEDSAHRDTLPLLETEGDCGVVPTLVDKSRSCTVEDEFIEADNNVLPWPLNAPIIKEDRLDTTGSDSTVRGTDSSMSTTSTELNVAEESRLRYQPVGSSDSGCLQRPQPQQEPNTIARDIIGLPEKSGTAQLLVSALKTLLVVKWLVLTQRRGPNALTAGGPAGTKLNSNVFDEKTNDSTADLPKKGKDIQNTRRTKALLHKSNFTSLLDGTHRTFPVAADPERATPPNDKTFSRNGMSCNLSSDNSTTVMAPYAPGNKSSGSYSESRKHVGPQGAIRARKQKAVKRKILRDSLNHKNLDRIIPTNQIVESTFQQNGTASSQHIGALFPIEKPLYEVLEDIRPFKVKPRNLADKIEKMVGELPADLPDDPDIRNVQRDPKRGPIRTTTPHAEVYEPFAYLITNEMELERRRKSWAAWPHRYDYRPQRLLGGRSTMFKDDFSPRETNKPQSPARDFESKWLRWDKLKDNPEFDADRFVRCMFCRQHFLHPEDHPNGRPNHHDYCPRGASGHKTPPPDWSAHTASVAKNTSEGTFHGRTILPGIQRPEYLEGAVPNQGNRGISWYNNNTPHQNQTQRYGAAAGNETNYSRAPRRACDLSLLADLAETYPREPVGADPSMPLPRAAPTFLNDPGIIGIGPFAAKEMEARRLPPPGSMWPTPTYQVQSQPQSSIVRGYGYQRAPAPIVALPPPYKHKSQFQKPSGPGYVPPPIVALPPMYKPYPGSKASETNGISGAGAIQRDRPNEHLIPGVAPLPRLNMDVRTGQRQ